MTTRRPRKRKARVASNNGRPKPVTQEERREIKYGVQHFLDSFNKYPESVMSGVTEPERLQNVSLDDSSLS